jgi:hypothetical protein
LASKNARKLKVVLLTGLVGILMTLNPSICQAQAEISPDHYEMTNAGLKPAVQNSNRITQIRRVSSKTPKAKQASRSVLMSQSAHTRKTIQASQTLRASQFGEQ